MKLPEFPVEGGCLCGAVRYRLSAGPLTVYNCHCRDCQHASGATNEMSMIVESASFEVLAGETVVYRKTAESGRQVDQNRCARCGNKIWNAPVVPNGTIVVKPGTLDDFSWAAPVGNIWTGSRMPWVKIDESLVNFSGQPADRQPLYDAWAAAVRAG